MQKHFLGRNETLVEAGRGIRPGLGRATSFQTLDGDTTRSVVFRRKVLQDSDRIGIFALGEQEFGSLLQPNDGNPENREHKDKGSRRVPDVAPPLIVGASTIAGILT